MFIAGFGDCRMTNPCSIGDTLSAALTPIIAILALYIGYQQYQTNKHKLRLELYEKRFMVYQSVMELLVSILKSDNVGSDELSQFYIKTNESEFLFNHEISNYIMDMKKKALRLQHLEKKFKQGITLDSDERGKLADEESELLEWFTDQFDETGELFMKYLSFKKI